MGFLTSFVENGEIRPSVGYKIFSRTKIRRKKSSQLLKGTTCDLPNCILGTKMRELEKRKPKHFSSFNPFRPTLSRTRGTNRSFYCTWVIIYNKTRQLFLFVLTDNHFWVLK